MYFISNSLPKSASTLLFELTKMSVIDYYGSSGQDALLVEIENGNIKGNGGFVEKLYDVNILEKLLQISEKYGPFVVKAHIPLSEELKDYITNKKIKVSYIYRDPRDALLSAMDNYEQTIKSGNVEFEECSSFENALNEYKSLSEQACSWKISGLAAMMKYEDFIVDTKAELIKLLENFEIFMPEEKIEKFISKTNMIQNSNSGWTLRYNKGLPSRHIKEMNKEQINRCNIILSEHLELLGYST